MAISLFFGLPGCGKTTLLAKFALDAVRRGKYDNVYTNVQVNIPGVTIIDNECIGKYELHDGLLLIDEATLFADSRDYKNFNRGRLEFFLEHRHRNIDIMLFTQQWDGVDRKIRCITDRVYHVKKGLLLGKWFSCVYRIPYDIIIPDPNKGHEKLGEIIQGYCKPNIIVRLLTGKRIFRPLYYKYFDSWELQPLSDLPSKYSPVPGEKLRGPIILHWWNKRSILLRLRDLTLFRQRSQNCNSCSPPLFNIQKGLYKMAGKKRRSAYLEKKQKQELRRYKAGLAFGLPLFLLAIPAYLLFTVFLYPTPNSGFLALGIAGSFIVGIGLLVLCFCLADFKDCSTFGTLLFCCVPLLVGTTMVAVSCVVMYIPEIYGLFDEKYITFYFTMWAFLLVLAILYAFARGNLLHYTGLSKTVINTSMKGARNYWWYEKLHSSHNLGIVYSVNKWFTSLYVATLFSHVVIGWMRFVMPAIGLMLTASAVLLLILWLSATCSASKKPDKSSRRNRNYLYALFYCIFILGICYASVAATVQLFRQ